MKSAKYLLEKCFAKDEDMEAAIFEWRNTPRADGFIGRRLRTKLLSLNMTEFEPQLFSTARAAT